VQHDDFKRLKAEIESNRDKAPSPLSDPAEVDARRRKLARIQNTRKTKLSFAFDDEGEEGSEGGTPSANESSAKPSRSGSVLDTEEDGIAITMRKRMKKDPTVNTSFLPDREREEQDRIRKEKEHEQWLKRQEEMKTETIDIQFAYYDGLSHLESVTVKKGEPVFNLIDRAKQSFSAIRDIATEKLLFAKDDIIIPHEMSFYYFASHQVKSKYGLLFEFYDPEAPQRLRNKNDVSPCERWV
jgi:protein FAM50